MVHRRASEAQGAKFKVNGGTGRNKARRAYQPGVENLEALRLLSGMVSNLLLPTASEVSPSAPAPAAPASSPSTETWDLALDQAWIAEFFDPASSDLLGPSAAVSDDAPLALDVDLDADAAFAASEYLDGASSDPDPDPDASRAGLSQLSRYLSKAWARAGIPDQKRDDCSQAVYVQMLQTLGRNRFDSILNEIDQSGIRAVFHRDSSWGPDFFRAVDAVKKRTQRERPMQTLDSADWMIVEPDTDSVWTADWREALHEAIAGSLNPREAALIQATINGETPAEIAARWGIAPKTVSNEKTRALQKLRDVLQESLN